MSRFYVLGGADQMTPVPATRKQWISANGRPEHGIVQRSTLPDGTTVVTRFWGVDRVAPPEGHHVTLFETTVRDPKYRVVREVPYDTWRDAEAGHERIVRELEETG